MNWVTNLSDSHRICAHNHLVPQQTLNHLAKLAKWLICVMSVYLYGASGSMLLSCHLHVLACHLHVFYTCRVSIHELSGCGYESCCCHLTSDILPVLSKEFLDIQATMECKFTLKHVTYSQLHLTDKYSWHGSIIWPIWLNGWVFVYKVSGCKNKSHCCHLNFTNRVCFKQGAPWHSGNYRL